MSTKSDNSNTIKKKKAMLVALEKSLGNVTTATKAVKIARSTHYEWYNGDAEYAKSVDEISEVALDFAESQLFTRMQGGSDAAIIFYLKTKGKKRGFIERSEIDVSRKAPDFSDLSTEEIRDILENGEDEGEAINS